MIHYFFREIFQMIENLLLEENIKILKRKPLTTSASNESAVLFCKDDIKKIIPHRFPFLLVDKINFLDIENSLITGERFIDEADSVFSGHFPQKPIYPGVLQIEIMAQLGLCLAYFVINNTRSISNQNKSVDAMITKLHYAAFNSAVSPNHTLAIHAKILDYNGIIGVIAGQIYVNNQLAAYSILEAYFND